MYGYDELSERELVTRHGRAAWSRAAGFFLDIRLEFVIFLQFFVSFTRFGSQWHTGLRPVLFAVFINQKKPILKNPQISGLKKSGK